MAGPPLECGMCDKVFHKKADLRLHMLHHDEPPKKSWKCERCGWTFDNEYLFEQHKIQAGHMLPLKQFPCDKCELHFPTVEKLDLHRQFPSKCSDAFQPTKPKILASPVEYTDPRDTFGLPDYVQTPADLRSVAAPSVAYSSATQNSQDGGNYCQICTKSFVSPAQYNHHFLGCRPPVANALKHAPPTTQKNIDPATASESAAPRAHMPLSTVVECPTLETEHPAPASKPTQPVVTTASPSAPKYKSTEPPTSAATATPTPRNGHPAPSAAPYNPAIARIKQGHQVSRAAETPKRKSKSQNVAPVAQKPAPGNLPTLVANNFAIAEIRCKVNGCGRTFRTDAGMKMHKLDAHGIGGRGLDLHGKDSWMLPQRVREQAKQEGRLRNPGNRAPLNPMRGNVPTGRPHPSPFSQQVTSMALNAKRAPPPPMMAMPVVAAIATGGNAGGPGPEDAEQAENVAGKIMRLILQVDIVIQHDGKITYSGLGWTRIGAPKQADIVHKFDELCHLPRFLQDEEFVPAPITLKDDYQYYNPVADFKNSPDPSPNHHGLGVVAVACSKIKMANGCLEAVKIAAVDVATCRILMSHLVCGKPTVPVQNWNTEVTGLRGFDDMEAARQEGYKVLKGWQAARAALWKFIDKETILIGHNLRTDLDALRMIHGRAVDVAKEFEQAANGPLSRQQISLESLSRGLLEKELPTDPRFGRDALLNAFAVRELALCRIKFDDKWVKLAKAKSLEYQRAAPVLRN